jgi:hypothetical protein
VRAVHTTQAVVHRAERHAVADRLVETAGALQRLEGFFIPAGGKEMVSPQMEGARLARPIACRARVVDRACRQS